MSRNISGVCLCGAIKFTVKDQFDSFYFCHCQQCRKFTGSSHASNLLTSADNIQWESGYGKAIRYDHEERAFTKVFCSLCGTGLPHQSKDGRLLVVPAGSLDSEPLKIPNAQIFCSEKTGWFTAGYSAPEYLGFIKET